MLRVIQNYRPLPGDPGPDERDEDGEFKFIAPSHGPDNDQNLITGYTLDKLGRQVAVTDPAGNSTQTGYDRDGQVRQTTDPLGVVTAYRYDRARRRKLVVQNHVPGTLSDPDTWVWNGEWKDGSNVAIGHGPHNDQNVVVAVESDKAGRMTALRDPRGKRTTYTYDLLDRRTGLTNPLAQTWATAYERLSGGGMRTTLTDPLSQQTRQETDRLGRLQRIAYLDESVPKATPDVIFTYDKVGSRQKMSESDGQSAVRETHYAYDGLSRLASVGFDHGGGGSVDETVAYAYDAGGLRTRLTLPGNLAVTYEYDARGSLVRLTDWSGQATALTHDGLGRMRTTRRANGLESQHTYDVAGRLRKLAHVANGRRAAEFQYTVDARGNRTSTAEYTARADAGSMTVLGKDDSAVNYTGTWADDGAFKRTDDVQAKVTVAFSGDNLAVTLGTGPAHGRCDLYLDGAFQDTVELFAEEAGERLVGLTLTQAGAHTLEVRNRTDGQSGGNILRFKAVTLYALDLHTWQYTYDALARLNGAQHRPGTSLSGTPARDYTFAYDVAGNRIQQALSLNGSTPTVSDWEYNDVNQMTGGGIQYDAAGRMTSDGTNGYTWDRASRLVGIVPPFSAGFSYVYNGLGQRIRQDSGGIPVTVRRDYLPDVQPGLWQVAVETRTTFDEMQGQTVETFRALHGPLGLLAQQDAASAWDWPLTDGLGSVRAVLDGAGNPLHALHYAPYGEPFDGTGTPQLPHGFTGEPTDGNGLVYLRARYYVPGLGVFPSLDPVEDGNRYAYVGGNVVNKTDPLGLCALAEPWCPKALQNAGVTLSAIGSTLAAASGPILTGGAVVVGGAIVYILFSTPPRPLSPEEISQLIAYELNSIPPTNEAERIRVAALVYAKYGMTVMAQPQTEAPAIPIPKVYPDTTAPGNIDVWRDTLPEWQAADPSPAPQPGPFAPPSPATPMPCSTPTPKKCPISVREIFGNPPIIAGKMPNDIRCAFQVPDSLPGIWVESPATGRSTGTKFQLLTPGYATPTGNVTLRWSSGQTERHWNSPYWKFTITNGNPPALWVASSGTLYTEPPAVISGTYTPGQTWNGVSLLPLPEPFQTWAFGR